MRLLSLSLLVSVVWPCHSFAEDLYIKAHRAFATAADVKIERELLTLSGMPFTCRALAPDGSVTTVSNALIFTDKYGTSGNWGVMAQFKFNRSGWITFAHDSWHGPMFMNGDGPTFADALNGEVAIRRIAVGHYLLERVGGFETASEFKSPIKIKAFAGTYYDCVIDPSVPPSALPNPADLQSIRSYMAGRRCLDFDPVVNRVQIWDCDPARDQKFEYNHEKRTIMLRNLCLTVTKDEKSLELRVCDSSLAQVFNFSWRSNLFIHLNEKVLTVRKDDDKNGALVQVKPSSKAKNGQFWKM